MSYGAPDETPVEAPLGESTVALAELVRHSLLDSVTRKWRLNAAPALPIMYGRIVDHRISTLSVKYRWAGATAPGTPVSADHRRMVADRLPADLAWLVHKTELHWPELAAAQSPPLTDLMQLQLQEIAAAAGDRLTGDAGGAFAMAEWAVERTADALHTLAGRTGLLRSQWLRRKYGN